jgi:hypothetical protein
VLLITTHLLVVRTNQIYVLSESIQAQSPGRAPVFFT